MREAIFNNCLDTFEDERKPCRRQCGTLSISIKTAPKLRRAEPIFIGVNFLIAHSEVREQTPSVLSHRAIDLNSPTCSARGTWMSEYDATAASKLATAKSDVVTSPWMKRAAGTFFLASSICRVETSTPVTSNVSDSASVRGIPAPHPMSRIRSGPNPLAEKAEPSGEFALARLLCAPLEIALRDLIVRLGNYQFRDSHRCRRFHRGAAALCFASILLNSCSLSATNFL
jgi:hypothetical protein